VGLVQGGTMIEDVGPGVGVCFCGHLLAPLRVGRECPVLLGRIWLQGELGKLGACGTDLLGSSWSPLLELSLGMKHVDTGHTASRLMFRL
jgi:hypothetical protein